MVLARRFTAVTTPLGIDLTNWPDSATFSSTTPQGAQFEIQDSYKVPTIFNIGDKWGHVAALLPKAQAAPSNQWFINYLSGSGAAFPNAVAYGSPGIQGINRRMLRWLMFALDRPGRFGTIMMDFPEFPGDNELIEFIYGTNFGPGVTY